jgi:hypothetical protein
MAKTLISLNRQGVVDGDLNAAGFRFTNVAAGTDNTDAIIKSQLDGVNTALQAQISSVASSVAAITPESIGAINVNQKGAANGVATLGADQKIPSSQLPAIAITDTFVVATEAAMLALVAERGDIAIRTDVSKTFILATDTPANVADWKEVLVPAAPVQTVNGYTGNVVLTSADVGACAAALATGKIYVGVAGVATAVGYVTRELPIRDVANTVFTLANTAVAGSEMVFVNGLLMSSGDDYSAAVNAGKTEFTFVSALTASDKVVVSYLAV